MCMFEHCPIMKILNKSLQQINEYTLYANIFQQIQLLLIRNKIKEKKSKKKKPGTYIHF